MSATRNDSTVWPDARINDLARIVRKMENVPVHMATLAATQEALAKDVDGVAASMREIAGSVDRVAARVDRWEGGEEAAERRSRSLSLRGTLLQGWSEFGALLVAVVALVVATTH